MDHIPVEVIGNILSHLGTARDVIVASTTCKKWREAWQNHLQALSFEFKHWHSYDQAISNFTEIILQTKSLQRLSICIYNEPHVVTPAVVSAWLMHPRATLRRFCFDGNTVPEMDILEKCGLWTKPEELVLSNFTISRACLNYPALRSLSLTRVMVKALDLSLLVANCPELEALSLIKLDIRSPYTQPAMKLTSASLKDILVESIDLYSSKFILEADRIEGLRFRGCTLELFKLASKGSLRVLQIGRCRVLDLDIGENPNLEVVDVYNFTSTTWPRLFHSISTSSNVRKLSMRGFHFDGVSSTVDLNPLNSLWVHFPHLDHLSLSDHALRCVSSTSDNGFHFETVTVLEVGWTVITDQFSDLVAGMLERCPRLRKLVIYGAVLKETHVSFNDLGRGYFKVLADLTTSIFLLMKKYEHVEVKFEYK